MKKLILFIISLTQLAFTQQIAYTSFEEPATGGKYTDTGDAATDHALVNNEGQADVNYVSTGAELGFNSWYFNTLNNVGLTDGDFVGVTDYSGAVGAYPDGTKGFQMSDIDGFMVTTLDTVDISSYASVQVSLQYFVNDDSWESADYIRVWLVLDGSVEMDLLNTDGSDIDDLGIEGSWMTLSKQVSGYSKLNVKLGLQCNAGNEAVYFDDIRIMQGGTINIPPQVEPVGVSAKVPQATEDLIDSVKVSDDGTLAKVELRYTVNQGDTASVDMQAVAGDSIYRGVISASEYNDGDALMYWVYVEDDGGAVATTDAAGFFAGTTPILTLKQTGANQELLYEGYYARTTGVATVSDSVFDMGNLSVYIQDENFGAINVFRFDAGDRDIVAGHSYTVTGELQQYNGLAQISPDDAVSDIIDNGEAVMPEAVEVTIAYLLSGAESFEGLLIKILNADTLAGTSPWPAAGSNANMTISDDGGVSQLTLRIDKETDIDDSPQPAWPQHITGLFTQFDFSSPFNEGYQILPRSMADFAEPTAINEKDALLPDELKLYAAYPNPFNPATTLRFTTPRQLAGHADLELAVFNNLGQKVRTLIQGALPAGEHTATWDGTTSDGRPVASGVYIAVLKAGSLVQTTKLVLMK